MAITTVSQQAIQSGRNWEVWGTAIEGAGASSTLAAFVDLSGFTLSVQGRDPYTGLKVQYVILSTNSLNDAVAWDLYFDATTNVGIASIGGGILVGDSCATWDFSGSINGGLKDPQDGGTTGDIALGFTLQAGVTAADELVYYIKGELF